jgi:hypothetical protein
MFHGQVVGVFDRDEVDLAQVGLLMTGGSSAAEPERKAVAA